MKATTCLECDSPLPADAPQGLCPKCLYCISLDDAGRERAKSRKRRRSARGPLLLEEISALLPELEFTEVIGRGGIGAVYKARQPSLDRLAAVKVLPKETASDPDFAEKFSQVAQALTKLNHPNIVSVFDFGIRDGISYLITEYVDGVNLRDLVRDSSVKPDEALEIAGQISSALARAHEREVVHCDIKPENVLIDRTGCAKLADFGIAKLLQGANASRSSQLADVAIGTLSYIAPEQRHGRESVDHRTDIYSLGVVLYELLTGEAPKEGFAPGNLKTSISSRLDRLVRRALQADPEKRPSRALDVETEILAITQDLRDFIRFSCSECGKRIKVSQSSAGKSGACPKCGGAFTVPRSGSDDVPPQIVIGERESQATEDDFGEFEIDTARLPRKDEASTRSAVRFAALVSLLALIPIGGMAFYLFPPGRWLASEAEGDDSRSLVMAEDMSSSALPTGGAAVQASEPARDQGAETTSTTSLTERQIEAIGYFLEEEVGENNSRNTLAGILMQISTDLFVPTQEQYDEIVANRAKADSPEARDVEPRDAIRVLDPKMFVLRCANGEEVAGKYLYSQSDDGSSRGYFRGVTRTMTPGKDSKPIETHIVLWEVEFAEEHWPLMVQYANEAPVVVPKTEIKSRPTDISMPDIPSFDIPTFEMPNINVPNIEIPTIPNINVPTIPGKSPPISGGGRNRAPGGESGSVRSGTGRNERQAQRLLDRAKRYLESGNTARGRAGLETLSTRYADTRAATEAERLLEGLPTD